MKARALLLLLAATTIIFCRGASAAPQYDEAKLNAAIQANADDSRAWFRLGVLQTHDGRILQAIEAFRQVVRINPEAAEPHHNLAAIYESLGDYDTAADELKKVIALAPRDIRAQIELADLYLKRAEGIYRAIARRDADNRVVKRDRLAALLCRRTLSRHAKNGTKMEEILQRLVSESQPDSPSPVRPVAEAPSRDLPKHTVKKEPQEPKKQPPVTELEKQPPVTKKAETPPPQPSPAPVPSRPKVTQQEEKAAEPGDKKNVAGTNTAKDTTSIRNALEEWRHAWESLDPNRYFSHYSRAFVPPRRPLAKWRQHKRSVFKRAKEIHVRLTHIRITQPKTGRARIHLKQTYRSDRYHETSKKLIEMVREDGLWKIIREVSLPDE